MIRQPMETQLRSDVLQRLESDFGLQHMAGTDYMRKGTCPQCSQKRLFSRYDNPWFRVHVLGTQTHYINADAVKAIGYLWRLTTCIFRLGPIEALNRAISRLLSRTISEDLLRTSPASTKGCHAELSVLV